MKAEDINNRKYAATPEQLQNMQDLAERVTKLEEAYGKPFKVTSGLRSQADQARINPKAPKSNHLMGNAVDVADDGTLYKWLHENPMVMELAGLYGETGTKGWVHLQRIAPHSGNRWFVA